MSKVERYFASLLDRLLKWVAPVRTAPHRAVNWRTVQPHRHSLLNLSLLLLMTLSGTVSLATAAESAEGSANSTTLVTGQVDLAARAVAVDISKLGDRAPLNAALQVLIDRDHLDLEQVRSTPGLDWRYVSDGAQHYGHSAATHWFRVTLAGVADLREPTYLHIGYPLLDHVEVSVYGPQGRLAQWQTGSITAFATRPILDRDFLFPLDPQWGNSVQIYIRVQTQGTLKLPLSITTQAGLAQSNQPLLIWLGAFFGITLALLLLAIYRYTQARDKADLCFAFYITSTLMLQFTLLGFGFEWLWPNSPGLNHKLVLLFYGLTPMTGVAFVNRFIGISVHGTRREHQAIRIIYGFFTLTLLSIPLLSYAVVLALNHVMTIIALTAGAYVGFKYAARGQKAARPFTVAWVVYLVMIADFLLGAEGWTQSPLIADRALEIGTILHLLILNQAFIARTANAQELRLSSQHAMLENQLRLNQVLDEQYRELAGRLIIADEKLREVSVIDTLTGLYNRRYFNEYLEREYRRAFRDQRSLAVVLIDVDHFSVINETHGQQAGDACLTQIAEVVRTSVRRPPDLIARYDGEEFIALLPSTDLAGACCVAELVCFNIADSDIIHEQLRLKVTVSIGVAAEIPNSPEGSVKLLKLAEERLSRAKARGRNQVHTSLSDLAEESPHPPHPDSPEAHAAPATVDELKEAGYAAM